MRFSSLHLPRVETGKASNSSSPIVAGISWTELVVVSSSLLELSLDLAFLGSLPPGVAILVASATICLGRARTEVLKRVSHVAKKTVIVTMKGEGIVVVVVFFL